MANYVDIKTNIPEIVTFKFSTWKRWENDGKNGKYIKYTIGVENRGEDKYLSLYENEYKRYFENLGDMRDRTVEILKYEDGKYKAWKITENGVEVKSGTNTPLPTENAMAVPSNASQGHSDCEITFAKMRTAFKAMENRVEALETLLTEIRSKDAIELHQATAGTSKTVQQIADELEGELDNEGFTTKSSNYRV